MQIATRQGPAYGVARLGLTASEQVYESRPAR
jgi:hypothetical protein